jgi:1-acyl-sn-glycerol-3-phosphate acyltransferase
MAGSIKQALARGVCALTGWTVIPRGAIPDKCVVIGYPHTTNWDFALVILASMFYGKRLNWLGKVELFSWGMGPVMRRLGGIAVTRNAAHGKVDEVTAAFDQSRELRIVVPPEGTRKHTPHWKIGFYRIAYAANVPLHLARFDYVKRTIDFGEPMFLTGDVPADMDRIRAAYEGCRGLYDEQQGPVALKDEARLTPIIAALRRRGSGLAKGPSA